MNQGSRTGKATAFMVCRRPEELYPGGDRALVVARKRDNARGAKGGRKAEPLNKRRKEANTVNVLWTQFGEEHKMQTCGWCKVSVGRFGNESQPWIEPKGSMDASVDAGDLPVRFGWRGKAYFVPTPIILIMRSRITLLLTWSLVAIGAASSARYAKRARTDGYEVDACTDRCRSHDQLPAEKAGVNSICR
jgi:hypothetical protein